MMLTLRFVQLSDVHLDSSLAAGRLGLSPEKVRARQKEIRSVLENACALASEKRVDAMLVPGDLFDDEAVSLDTVNFVISLFASLAPIPVVVAPGNHDFFSLGSPYNNELLAARRQRSWPANVKIFRSASWETWRPARLPHVSMTGMAHAAGAGIGERLLASGVPRDGGAGINLLLFHGSRDNTLLPAAKLRTLPFSDAELAALGFDYAAVGHYHEGAAFTAPDGRILGAYSGCPAGRGLDEAGEKSVLLGTIDKEEGRDARVRLERVALDRRRIQIVEVPCTGLTHREAIVKRVEEQISVRDLRHEDMICLRLTGRLAAGVDPRLPEGLLSDRFFHVTIDASRLRPGYDLDRYRREELKTTEARFARDMLRRIDEAQSAEEKRLIENALFYGLDALIQKEVSPRYEE